MHPEPSQFDDLAPGAAFGSAEPVLASRRTNGSGQPGGPVFANTRPPDADVERWLAGELDDGLAVSSTPSPGVSGVAGNVVEDVVEVQSGIGPVPLDDEPPPIPHPQLQPRPSLTYKPASHAPAADLDARAVEDVVETWSVMSPDGSLADAPDPAAEHTESAIAAADRLDDLPNEEDVAEAWSVMDAAGDIRPVDALPPAATALPVEEPEDAVEAWSVMDEDRLADDVDPSDAVQSASESTIVDPSLTSGSQSVAYAVPLTMPAEAAPEAMSTEPAAAAELESAQLEDAVETWSVMVETGEVQALPALSEPSVEPSAGQAQMVEPTQMAEPQVQPQLMSTGAPADDWADTATIEPPPLTPLTPLSPTLSGVELPPMTMEDDAEAWSVMEEDGMVRPADAAEDESNSGSDLTSFIAENRSSEPIGFDEHAAVPPPAAESAEDVTAIAAAGEWAVVTPAGEQPVTPASGNELGEPVARPAGEMAAASILATPAELSPAELRAQRRAQARTQARELGERAVRLFFDHVPWNVQAVAPIDAAASSAKAELPLAESIATKLPAQDSAALIAAPLRLFFDGVPWTANAYDEHAAVELAARGLEMIIPVAVVTTLPQQVIDLPLRLYVDRVPWTGRSEVTTRVVEQRAQTAAGDVQTFVLETAEIDWDRPAKVWFDRVPWDARRAGLQADQATVQGATAGPVEWVPEQIATAVSAFFARVPWGAAAARYAHLPADVPSGVRIESAAPAFVDSIPAEIPAKLLGQAIAAYFDQVPWTERPVVTQPRLEPTNGHVASRPAAHLRPLVPANLPGPEVPIDAGVAMFFDAVPWAGRSAEPMQTLDHQPGHANGQTNGHAKVQTSGLPAVTRLLDRQVRSAADDSYAAMSSYEFFSVVPWKAEAVLSG